ncbi:MAG TPA: endonuclease MutS2 [Firmicutes bacterium]|jgi:DNA mismatch repair protein MutS2|nr:endonuclease MutS2 [Bacillota bacterium]
MGKIENLQEKSGRILEFDKIRKLLAGFTASEPGEELALSLWPSTVPEEVARAQKETTEARELWQTSRIPLDGIFDIRAAAEGARRGKVLSPEELLATGSTLRAARLLRGVLADEAKEKAPVLSALAAGLTAFPQLEKALDRAIGPDGEVRDEASPTLRSLRRQARTLQNNIRERLDALTRSGEAQKYLQETLVTIRNGRYVLPVKQEFRQFFPGIVHDQSASGATLFIEPMAVVELNNKLRRVEAETKEEIERILAELSQRVGEAAAGILANQEILARLDLAFAKGRYSLSIRGTEPVLNTKGFIRLLRARHPLLEGEVVPIDLELGGDFHVLVITGPNTGGKTVSLKTTGLLALMTQAGLHIPARSGSEMPVFTGIYSDIGDEQSIEQNLSTFSSHMSNIVPIMEAAQDQNNLVLLDELGAGTDPAEGAALATAILKTLHDRGVRTVATTHYSDLKIFAYNTPGVENASVDFDPQTLQPTYRLLTGVAGQSNAFVVASRLGLDKTIIDQAERLVAPGTRRLEELVGQIAGEKRELETEREKATRFRLALEKKEQEYTEKLARLEKGRDSLLREAREEAREMIRETRREMENLLRRLREAAPEEKSDVVNEARRQLAERLAEIPEETGLFAEGGPSGEILPGKTVRLSHLDQEGVVLEVKSGQAQVQVEGGLRVWVPCAGLAEVSRGPEQRDRRERGGIGRAAVNKSKTISPRLDLRGMKVEEALEAVDKYLDEAFLAGLPSAVLIHGKGTGALRGAVTRLLSGHPQVKSYRLGGIGEGGLGVTVVELKK